MATYEELDAELFHKGNGNRMSRRKAGNNTWLVRMHNDDIAVLFHRTHILRFTPDGRVVLTSGGWTTATTKDRMNQYLGRENQVFSTHGNWWVSVNFPLFAVDRWNPNWNSMIKGRIPFEDGMTLDVRTGRLRSHPDQAQVDTVQQVQSLVTALNQHQRIGHELREKADAGTLTKDDIAFAIRSQEQQEEVAAYLQATLERLVSASKWGAEAFHNDLTYATRKHAEKCYPLHEANSQLKGQTRAEDLMAPVDLDNTN